MPNFYNTRATGQQLDQLPDVIEKVNRIDQEVSQQKEDIADLMSKDIPNPIIEKAIRDYIESNPIPGIEIDKNQLEQYLSTNEYVKKPYVDDEIAKVEKVEINVNGGLDVDEEGNANLGGGGGSITEAKVNELIDAKLSPLEVLADNILEVI